MSIKSIYQSGFTYSPTDDENTIVPAIVDVVQGESQMANPATDVVWDSEMGAARFFMDFENPTQTGSTIAGRTEQTTRYPNVMEAEEMWFSGSYYLPTSYADDTEEEVIHQWHTGSIGGSPNFSIRIRNGRFVAYLWIESGFLNQMAFDIGPATREVWHDFIVKLKMHPTDGELTVWKDGRLARCHNPVTGEEWSVPTSPPGGGVTNDYTAYPDLGAIQQNHDGVSLLVWNGKTARGTYPNPTKYPKWGFYKSIWGSRYNSDKSIKPESYNPSDPLYVAPEFRQKTIYIKNIKFETRLEEFTNEENFQSLDVNGNLPLEIPNWWGSSYSGPYYVSNSGSDVNNGSQDFPFAKHTKAESLAIPGDIIYSKRGDKFPFFNPTKAGVENNPIQYDAYGDPNDPLPEFNGMEELTGWTSIGNGLYSITNANLPDRVNFLLIDGELSTHAKDDWKQIISSSGSTSGSVTSPELSGKDYTGGEVCIKKRVWVLDRANITSHSSSTLSFANSGSTYDVRNNYGYFIQNHRGLCNQLGDWCQEGDDIVMYFGSENPNDYTIEAPTYETMLFNNADYVWFNNHRFIGLNGGSTNENNVPAILLNSSSNVRFQTCHFEFIGNTLFHFEANDNSGFTLQGSTVKNCLNLAFWNRYSASTPSFTIENNLFENIGHIRGAGGSGDQGYSAIIFAGSTNGGVVQGNRMKNIGYNGINFNGYNLLIKNNYVENACSVLGDGGCFYSYGKTDLDDGKVYSKSTRIVESNIALNSTGTNEGLPDWFSGTAPDYAAVEAYYLDDDSNELTVINNTGVGCRLGLKAQNTNQILCTGNLFVANKSAQVLFANNGSGSLKNRNITFENNILYAEQDQLVIRFDSIDSNGGMPTDAGLLGTLDNNYYMRPSNEEDIIRIEKTGTGPSVDLFSLSEWKESGYGHDANTKGSPTTSTDYEIALNDTSDILDYIVEGDMIDVDGSEVTGTIELDPYTATLLLAPSDVPPVEEYTVTVIAGDGGSVTGSGTYTEDDTATLTATPNAGWHFVRWSNDVTDNPYSFTVTEDVTLQAIFEQDEPVPGVIVVKGKFRIV